MAALVLCVLPSSAADELQAVKDLLALPQFNSGWVFIGDELASGSTPATSVLVARFSRRGEAEAFAARAAQRCGAIASAHAPARIDVFQQRPPTMSDPPLIAFP